MKKDNYFEKLGPILMFVVVIMAFGIGVLWQRVSSLESVLGSGKVAGNAVAPTNTGDSAAPADDQAGNLDPVTTEDHIRGSYDNAELFLVEYSDYQCPFCARFHPTTNDVLKAYGDKVALVYRHFPLDSLHPQARPAAVASECVAEIGGEDAFWSYTDYLFENQETALNDLAASAAAIGVDSSAVQNCIDSGKYASLINDDYQSGLNAGVTGTPGNFVTNKKGDVWVLPGAVPFATVKQVIDEALSS